MSATSKSAIKNITLFKVQDNILDLKVALKSVHTDTRDIHGIIERLRQLQNLEANWDNVKKNKSEWLPIIKKIYGENATVRSPTKTKGHAGGSRKKRGTRRHRR
jgi:hypothetical protein